MTGFHVDAWVSLVGRDGTLVYGKIVRVAVPARNPREAVYLVSAGDCRMYSVAGWHINPLGGRP